MAALKSGWLGLLLTLVFAELCAPAFASVNVPQRSLRWLGGRQVWVPLCSRRGVNGSAAWFDNVNTAIMDQQACISPSWGTIIALKLVYAGFDMPQQGEIDRAITATGTASIFVPSLNSNQVYSGNGVGSGSSTLNLFSSTALGVNSISLGQFISSSGTGVAPGAYVASVVNGFSAGSGNVPGSTTVTMSVPTNGATATGQPFSFSGLFTPIKFGGRRTFLVEPGHDVVTSDPASLVLPPSTWFFVRTSASMSSPGLQLMDTPALARLSVAGPNGTSFLEFDSRGTALNDQTMSPAALANTGGGYWGATMVLAQVSPTTGQIAPGAALILGDSIAAGTGDNPDGLGFEGYIQRSLENNLPFVTAARGSTTAFGLLAHGDGQYAMAIDTGITDVLLEAGRNDIEQFGLTASQVETTVKAIASRYTTAGKRVWCFTVPPTTYSNDGWTTSANQSFPAAVDLTGSATTASGAVQITMASVAGISVGQSIGQNLSAAGSIAPGSTVTAINNSTLVVTISSATTSSLAAGSKLYFGNFVQSASPLEVQRAAYNAYLRGNLVAEGCSGLVDIDGVVADPSSIGKWRTDFGQASIDGVHPSAMLHQAAVSSGIISPGMFSPP